MTARTPVAMVPAIRPTLCGWAAGWAGKRRKFGANSGHPGKNMTHQRLSAPLSVFTPACWYFLIFLTLLSQHSAAFFDTEHWPVTNCQMKKRKTKSNVRVLPDKLSKLSDPVWHDPTWLDSVYFSDWCQMWRVLLCTRCSGLDLWLFCLFAFCLSSSSVLYSCVTQEENFIPIFASFSVKYN